MLSRKVILRALACALLAMVPFPDLENQLYDLKVKLLSKTQFRKPEGVVVLEVSKDDFESLRRRFSRSGRSEGELGPWREKFEALRTQFFWDDQVYEGLLRRILSDQPKKLLITFFYGDSLVLLPNKSELQQLARKPEVLWASQFDLESKLLKPAPELTGMENYGFTNLHPDVDGVVRKAYLIHKNHISLPFRALLEGAEPFRSSLPLSEPFLIRYYGPPGFITTCSVNDLFLSASESSRCGNLKNKYVIVSPSGGMVAGAMLYRTPVGYMSRGEVLANILLTSKKNSAYIPVGNNWLLIFIIGHCLLLALIVMNFNNGRLQLLLFFSVLMGEALLSLLLMRVFLLQVPFVPFLIGATLSFIAFQTLRFAEQESEHWETQKKAQYLRELDELKSNFLSLMSHDLKTPIAKVQALAERLQREAIGLTEEQREILNSIQRSNDELSQYILSILNFQRIESQELKVNRKNHDVNLMIEDVIERLRPLAQDRAVSVELDLEPMFPVEFDEQLIRQVLNNLVDNAIKYNKAGTRVEVRSRELGNFVEVSVEDNGVGIDKSQMSLLFKKFSRSEKGTSERVKGTGLGLYLAKYFIELHGGEIGMESEPGKRTRFFFRLPVTH